MCVCVCVCVLLCSIEEMKAQPSLEAFLNRLSPPSCLCSGVGVSVSAEQERTDPCSRVLPLFLRVLLIWRHARAHNGRGMCPLQVCHVLSVGMFIPWCTQEVERTPSGLV